MRRDFEIGLLGEQGHLAAREYVRQDQVARAQKRPASYPSSKSQGRTLPGERHGCHDSAARLIL